MIYSQGIVWLDFMFHLTCTILAVTVYSLKVYLIQDTALEIEMFTSYLVKLPLIL